MKGTLQKVETEEDIQRLAPHNAEAERQLLGAILVNNETFYRVSDFLEPHHFSCLLTRISTRRSAI